MSCWWIDDEAEAVLRVAGEDALDFAAGHVLSIGLDVDAGLGWVRRINGKDDWAGGAADGFEEFFGDRPIDQDLLGQGAEGRTTAR